MPSNPGAWKLLPAPDTVIQRSVICSYSGKVYAFTDVAVERLDPETETWETVYSGAPAIDGLTGSSWSNPAVVGHLAYVYSEDGEFGSFDMINMEWTVHATDTAKATLYGAALCGAQGLIYAVGGRNPSATQSVPWMRYYDPATDTWTVMDNLVVTGHGTDPTKGAVDSSLVTDPDEEYLYWFGGIQLLGVGNFNSPSDVVKYRIVTGTSESLYDTGGLLGSVTDQITPGAYFPLVSGDDYIWMGPGGATDDAHLKAHFLTETTTVMAKPENTFTGFEPGISCRLDGDYYVLGSTAGPTYKLYVYGAHPVGEIRLPSDEFIGDDSPTFMPAPEALPHVITIIDTEGNRTLQRKLQENFDSIQRQLLALDPETANNKSPLR